MISALMLDLLKLSFTFRTSAFIETSNLHIVQATISIIKAMSDSESKETEDNNTVIIDNGSGMIKAGFCGNDKPQIVFPTVVGRPRYYSDCGKHVKIGHEAVSKHLTYSLQYPIECVDVTEKNWDDMVCHISTLIRILLHMALCL